jgi:Protein of unknown function (DUF1329)
MRIRILLALVSCSVLVARADLNPGGVLDAEHAAEATPLLPPEVLAHYQAGEYRNALAAWPKVDAFEAAYAAASNRNAARLAVDAQGTIVEKDGGKPARGVWGLPFRIDASDPTAGVKVMWNSYYALWRVGSTHDVLALDWVSKKGLDRQAVLESQTLYYEGAPASIAPKDNPNDLASQQLATVSSPADLNGTASLAWRFRAPDKRDQSWTFIPALRRVRQVSPANRSDGFLGSDLSQDDGALFDGKPEDFTWKLVGEKEQLVLADPASLAGQVGRKVRPDGGFDDEWPADLKVVGHQDPTWKGLPWAPVAPVLVRRKLWIVEAKPNDPLYLFSRIELGIDQETFQGASSRKFDSQGVLLRSLQFMLGASQPVEINGEKLSFPATQMGYVLAENTKQARATVAATTPPGKSVHERLAPRDPNLFSLDRLQSGK